MVYNPNPYSLKPALDLYGFTHIWAMITGAQMFNAYLGAPQVDAKDEAQWEWESFKNRIWT